MLTKSDFEQCYFLKDSLYTYFNDIELIGFLVEILTEMVSLNFIEQEEVKDILEEGMTLIQKMKETNSTYNSIDHSDFLIEDLFGNINDVSRCFGYELGYDDLNLRFIKNEQVIC